MLAILTFRAGCWSQMSSWDVAEDCLGGLRDRRIQQIDRNPVGAFERLRGNDRGGRAGELAVAAADELRLRRLVRSRGNEAAQRRARLRTGRVVAGIATSGACIEPLHVVLKLRCCAGGKSDRAGHGKIPE